MHLLAFLMNKDWWAQNGATVILAFLVIVQWVGLQYLALNYYFFRKTLKKPTPDGIRFSIIERTISFQAEQIESIFKKLAELRKETSEVAALSEKRRGVEVRSPSTGSLESSIVSMGEIALKKRIQEMKSS